MKRTEFENTPEYIKAAKRSAARMKTGINAAIEYRKLFIVRKNDFSVQGHLIDGFFTQYGFIVTDGLCNVMPGACWFQTVRDTKTAIDDLLAARELGMDFWEFRKLRNGMNKKFSNMIESIINAPTGMGKSLLRDEVEKQIKEMEE